MWRFLVYRASVTSSNGQSDATELHCERTSIRIVAGAGYENDDHSADGFGRRFR